MNVSGPTQSTDPVDRPGATSPTDVRTYGLTEKLVTGDRSGALRNAHARVTAFDGLRDGAASENVANLYRNLLLERMQPTPDRTPEQIQHERMQELIGLIASCLTTGQRRNPGKPITTREVRQARRLRHSGLTWREVGDRMGTNPARARQAAQKITPTLKESA